MDIDQDDNVPHAEDFVVEATRRAASLWPDGTCDPANSRHTAGHVFSAENPCPGQQAIEAEFEDIQAQSGRYVYTMNYFTSTFPAQGGANSAEQVNAGLRTSVDTAIVFLPGRFTDLQLWWQWYPPGHELCTASGYERMLHHRDVVHRLLECGKRVNFKNGNHANPFYTELCATFGVNPTD